MWYNNTAFPVHKPMMRSTHVLTPGMFRYGCECGRGYGCDMGVRKAWRATMKVKLFQPHSISNWRKWRRRPCASYIKLSFLLENPTRKCPSATPRVFICKLFYQIRNLYKLRFKWVYVILCTLVHKDLTGASDCFKWYSNTLKPISKFP